MYSADREEGREKTQAAGQMTVHKVADKTQVTRLNNSFTEIFPLIEIDLKMISQSFIHGGLFALERLPNTLHSRPHAMIPLLRSDYNYRHGHERTQRSLNEGDEDNRS